MKLPQPCPKCGADINNYGMVCGQCGYRPTPHIEAAPQPSVSDQIIEACGGDVARLSENLRSALANVVYWRDRCERRSKERDEAREAHERAMAVVETARNVHRAAHTSHWDKTGGSGSGCPACIHDREWNDALHAALRAYDAALPPPADAPRTEEKL